MSKEPKPKTALTLKNKIGYGLGDLGGCMTFALMGTYFSRYCLNILQVNNALLAILLAIWNIWDAVNDPLMGALMDKLCAKHPNKKGKFRPWLLRSTPMVVITFIALWTIPTFFEVDSVALIASLFICKILYEGFYTMFNIPMGSLLSAMSDTDEERASLSSARGFGSVIGNLLPTMIFPAILSAFGDNNPTGYSVGAVVCAVIGGVFCFGHYFLTEEHKIVEASSKDADNIKFTDIIGVFRKNRPFVALCLHGVCFCVSQYVASTLGSYMYADVLGSIGLMTMASVISMPISIITLAVAPKISKKLGLENMVRYSLVLSAVLYIALFVAHMVTDVNAYVHMVWSSLASGLMGISVLMQWGLVGEAIDYNEYVTGKRTEGSIYGTFNLARRIGQTVGNSLAVLMLGWIGYDTAVAAAGGVQAASVITGIKVLCVLLPAIFCFGSWAAFKFVWNITPEVRAKMAEFTESKKLTK